MTDIVHFEGDPATDSARRHLERVLTHPEPSSRWPWMLAALGSGGAWFIWRRSRTAARTKEAANRKTLPTD